MATEKKDLDWGNLDFSYRKTDYSYVSVSYTHLLGEQAADAVEEIGAHNRTDRRGDDDTGERHLRLRGEEARQRKDELAGDRCV